MAYPINDDQSLQDAVNLLLSGPSGLGQNFAGFSQYNDEYSDVQYYMTGNSRTPFSQAGLANLYVAPINITNCEQIDNRTIKYSFTPQSSPPFSLGNGLTVDGVTPSTYNNSSLKAAGANTTQIGVIECTDSYVLVRTVGPIQTPLGTYVSGGTITYVTALNYDDSGYTSTDCDIRVTVNSATARVFIAGQLTQDISYDVLSGSAKLQVWVVINRYVGSLNSDPTNPDYIFEKDATIARRIYNFDGLSGTGILDPIETIFTSIVDTPVPGYYRYILEVIYQYPVDGNIVEVTSTHLGLRSISAQVVKQ
jgi:hypothetical protein